MKCLIVDDHFMIREALRGVLRELDEGATILEASCWCDASRLLEECLDVSLVLLDLGLPDQDGFAALRKVRESHPDTSIVVLSGSCNRENVVKALNLGAAGFIPKSGQREVMLGAMRLVFSGGVYIPTEVLAGADEPKQSGQSISSDSGSAGIGQPSPADLGLTARQIDVLALMTKGISNKGICRVLDLAEPTVRNHVSAILKTLKVSNRTEAVIRVGVLNWQLPRLD
jgi:DNA-binding NarL/FixJ family response regulator